MYAKNILNKEVAACFFILRYRGNYNLFAEEIGIGNAICTQD